MRARSWRKQSVPVRDGDTEETLAERVLEVEHRLYPQALRAVAEGRARVACSGNATADGTGQN